MKTGSSELEAKLAKRLSRDSLLEQEQARRYQELFLESKRMAEETDRLVPILYPKETVRQRISRRTSTMLLSFLERWTMRRLKEIWAAEKEQMAKAGRIPKEEPRTAKARPMLTTGMKEDLEDMQTAIRLMITILRG